MKRVFFLFLTIPIFFIACEKDSDDPDTEPAEKVTDYFPLEVGNYWVYKVYNCDSLEYDCEEYRLDTTTITDTTIIDGNKYYVLNSSYPPVESPLYLRDSGDYIIDSDGRILFAINNYNTVLYSYEELQPDNTVIYKIDYSISNEQEKHEFLEVEYDCYNYRGEVYMLKDNFSEPRYCNNLYAKNVGLMYDNYFYVSSESGIKRELIDYKVK